MPSNSLLNTLNEYPASHYVLGFSGGLDSHALLDMLYCLREQGALKSSLSAIHINHRLHPDADNWVSHCQAVCQRYNVPLIVETVDALPAAGESVEAFAREARYRLIEPYIDAKMLFLSAHHQRDQAETFLLQLMRGAGLAGLRAMPVVRDFGLGRYVRPLLAVPYSEVVAYAESRQLQYIHDDSNEDRRFDRNLLRYEILPLLEQRFPQAQSQIAQSAAWLAEVPEAPAPQTLSIQVLQTLSEVQQKQRLRAFVKNKTGLSLSKTQTHYVLHHHLTAGVDKHPALIVDNIVIRRFAEEIIVTVDFPDDSPLVVLRGDAQVGENKRFAEIGELTWQSGQGLSLSQHTPLNIRPLRGSQRFHPHTRSHSSTVKKLLHEARVPSWLRPWYFGLYGGDELLAIPNIGVAQSYYQHCADACLPLWQIATKFARL